jgi:hypothetical protein
MSPVIDAVVFGLITTMCTGFSRSSVRCRWGSGAKDPSPDDRRAVLPRREPQPGPDTVKNAFGAP